MYEAFMKWIPSIQDPELLSEIPGLLLEKTGIAIVWRCLFEAGAKQPQLLGIKLWKAAASITVLESASARKSAIELLEIMYPHVQLCEREEVERQWLSWDFSSYPEPELMRTLVLGTVLNALGEAKLTLDATRDFLRTATASGYSLDNDRPVNIESNIIEPIDSDEGERGPAADAGDTITDLSQTVRDAQSAVQVHITAEALNSLHDALVAFDAAVSRRIGDELPPFPQDEDTVLLAEGYGLLLTYQPNAAEVYPTVVARLHELTHHPSPLTEVSTEEDFAASEIWGFPPARIKAAKALASLVSVPGFWPFIRDRFADMLLLDPHPAVRVQLSGALYSLSQYESEAAWQLAATFAEEEKNPMVIRYALVVLQNFANDDAVRLEPLILKLLVKMKALNAGAAICTELILFFALKKDLPASQAQLQEWVDNYPDNEKPLITVSAKLRDYFAFGYGHKSPESLAIQQRAQSLIWSLVNAIESAVRAWPDGDRAPTDGEVIAHRILNELAGQFFYGVGYRLPANLREKEVKQRFIAEYAPLMTLFTTLGSPGTVHNVLKVLSEFVEADPVLCFDLFSEAILRTTGVAKYEHEHMGATRFVELVSEYLADYRFLFADETRRMKLIDCLAVFSDAGWPEARRLFQHLPDLLR